MDHYLEITGVIFSLLFLILLIRENIWCWLFGIIGSAISIYLFIQAKLYSEAILYLYYIGISFYGWWRWSKQSDNPAQIHIWSWMNHLLAILIGIGCALGLGWYFQSQTDANNPFEDAFSTIFSFIANYMEAQKVLSTWIFWMILNAFSVWLYYVRGLELYSGLMIVYFILSIVGYLQWRRVYKLRS